MYGEGLGLVDDAHRSVEGDGESGCEGEWMVRGREGRVRKKDWREGRGIIGGEGLGLEQ